MNINEILSKVDHTDLNRNATIEDIKKLIDDAVKYKTATVCIAPSFVEQAVKYSNNRIKICTVIGFPNGYNCSEVKCYETALAVKQGADEIDMVINIGDLKAKKYNDILSEINRVKAECAGKPLKVIIETCELDEEEKIKMCEIVSKSNADFIKTSTGFAKGGATFEDIILFKKYITNEKKIKAAGGIASINDAEKFINLGADRLGTSRVIKIIKQKESDNNDTEKLSDSSY